MVAAGERWAAASLFRDSDGYLWLGTFYGLYRYDGITFRKYPITLPNGAEAGFSGIHAGSSDDPAFWIQTTDGILASYDAERDTVLLHPRTTHLTDHTRPDLYASALTSDGADRLLMGLGTEGVLAFDKASRQWDRSMLKAAAADSITTLFYSSVTGHHVWAGTPRGPRALDPRTLDDVTPEYMRAVPSLHTATATAFAEGENALFIGTNQGEIFQYEPGQAPYRLPIDGTATVRTMVRSAAYENLLWFTLEGRGVYSYNLATEQLHHHTTSASSSFPLNPVVYDLIEDEQGIVWVASLSGLYRILPIRVQTLFLNDVLDERNATAARRGVIGVYHIEDQPNTLWFSTIHGPVYEYDLQRGTVRPALNDPEALDYIIAMTTDQQGQFWMAGRYSNLYLYNPTRRDVEAYPLHEGVRSIVHHLHPDSQQDHLMWVSTADRGLLGFDVETKQTVIEYTQEDQAGQRLESNYVFMVHEDRHEPGVLWVASFGGGIDRVDTRTGRIDLLAPSETNPSPCPPTNVLHISDSQQGGLWLGTYQSGLVHFDPSTMTCHTYTEEDGLPERTIPAAYEDRQGNVWATTALSGMVLFNPATKTVARFDDSHGFQNNVFYYQAHQRSAQGALLVGGPGGITYFHPDSLLFTGLPRPTRITSFSARGETLRPSATPLALSYRQNDIALSYAHLDLSRPELNRYQVRLDNANAEEAWSAPTTEATIRYHRLAPGSYTFHVRGANWSGAWSTPTSFTFRIRPPFWQAWWFWVLIGAGVTGLIAGGLQYRLVQLRRLTAIRHRIADDLHDDLGSRISAIALRLEIAQEAHGLPTDAERELHTALHETRASFDVLRDTVWAVDADHDRLPDLVTRMRLVMDALLEGRSYTFDAPTTLPAIALSMEVRRHLLFMFKESIHNAVRHSHADHVSAVLHMHDHTFCFTVTDNGRGFDTDTIAPGRGLNTLARRRDALAATLQIESQPGHGTVVRVCYPLGMK